MSSTGTPQSEGASPRIGFRPHPRLPWLLAPQGMPLQVLIEAVPVRVPNTRTWFRGVVSQRGNLLPVFDMAGWAGLPASGEQRPQIVAIGKGSLSCAVICDFAPTLIIPDDIVPDGIGPGGIGHDGVVPGDGALAPYLGRGYASAQGPAHDFDFRRWLTAAAQQINDVASG